MCTHHHGLSSHTFLHINNELITLLLNWPLACYMLKWSPHWTLNEVIIYCSFLKCIRVMLKNSVALSLFVCLSFKLYLLVDMWEWGYVAKYSTNSIERNFIFSLNLMYCLMELEQRSTEHAKNNNNWQFKIDHFLVHFWEDRITSTVQSAMSD